MLLSVYCSRSPAARMVCGGEAEAAPAPSARCARRATLAATARYDLFGRGAPKRRSAKQDSDSRLRRWLTAIEKLDAADTSARYFNCWVRSSSACSDFEERWFTLGMASEGKLLAVSYTYTASGSSSARVRIISAREATKAERRQYENEPR